MSAQSRNLVMVMTGAAIGGIAGYLFLTDDGRRLRRRLEPAVGDLVREIRQLGATVTSAGLLVREGLQVLNEMAGDADQASAWSAPLRQQDPF